MVRSDFLMEVRRYFVNPREGRLRAGWRLIVGLAVVFVAGAVVNTLAGRIGPLDGLGPVARGVAPLLAGTATNLLLTAVVAGLAVYLDRRRLPDIGLGGSGWWRNLGFGLLVGLAMTTAVFLLELALGLVAVEQTLVTRPGLGTGRALPLAVVLPVVFLYFVGVGFVEEVIVRGYLMVNLAEGVAGVLGRRIAVGFAALVTSALFGLLHFANPNATLLSTLNIAAAGLVLAWAFIVTDDLGISIGIHITWNFSLASLYGFPVSGITTPATLIEVSQTGPDLITGGRFGPEGGLVVYLALGLAVALTWWWARRYDGIVPFRDDIAVPDLRRQRSIDRAD